MRVSFDPKINTIFCDMDGVLADFDAFVVQHLGRTFNHQDGPADKEMWDFLSSVPNFYKKLPPMEYAQQLWNAIIAVGCHRAILTAIPRRATIPTAEQDKRDWIVAELVDPQPIEVRIGPYSRDKWKHAKPGDILIDDRHDNIREWIAEGHGIGIFHDGDIEKTLAVLKSNVG